MIRQMIAAVGDQVPIQLGGGIRDLDAIESYLDAGVTYVIIGTAAVKNPGFLSDACYAFPGHVIAGLDAKDGKVAVEGWSKLTGHDVIDLAKKYEEYGIEALIYTDIGRDGMMNGINIDATLKLAQQLKTPIIASGGHLGHGESFPLDFAAPFGWTPFAISMRVALLGALAAFGLAVSHWIAHNEARRAERDAPLSRSGSRSTP